MTETTTQHCGFIALIGRPNVGKSTLLNYIVGQKVSITSRKPQTTRHRIVGIRTEEQDQFVFVDTPGLHIKTPSLMNRMMNKAATSVFHDVDIVAWMIDASRWTKEDEWILEKFIPSIKVPIILLINKVDKIKEKNLLLPELNKFYQMNYFKAIIPVSARSGKNTEGFIKELKALLPERAFFYPEDQVTGHSVRFLCAELIREKVTRLTGQEMPYAVTVEIEKYEIKNNVAHIYALIWVEKENQKAILIGERGERLKNIGQQARLDMERMIQQKVFLKLWCKVKSGWSNDARALQSWGYSDKDK